MHPRDLALVGFRVLAAYVAVQSVGFVAQLGQYVANQPGFTGAEILGLSAMLLPVALAFLLWVLAPALSELATVESRSPDVQSGLSPGDLTRCGLILVGTFILVTTLPSLLVQLITLVDDEKTVATGWIVQFGLQCLMAVALIAGADRITRVVMRLRRAGLSQ